MHRIQRRLTLAILPLILLVCGISCVEPNERIEVTPQQQGRVTIKRVPYTPAELAAKEQQRRQELERYYGSLPTTTAPSPIPAVPLDAELAELELLWPKLSPTDKAAIIEMARKKASP